MTTARIAATPELDLLGRADVARRLSRLEPGETGVLRVPLGAGDLAATLGWDAEEAFYWASGDQCRVGLGVARSIRASGSTRLDAVRRAADRLARAVRRCDEDGAGAPLAVRWYGGLSFREHEGASDADGTPWSTFPEAEFVLPRWLLVAEAGRRWAECAVPGEEVRAAGAESLLAQLEEEHREIARRLDRGPAAVAPVRGVWVDPPAARQAWCETVARLLTEIRAGALDKVVPARVVEVELDRQPDLASLVRRLESSRQSVAFCVLKRGTAFLGATPERLVRRDGHSVFCHALAGSEEMAVRQGPAARRDELEAAATRLRRRFKDQTEHAWVTRHLVERLRPLCSVLEVPASPQVLALPGMLHLESPISGELAAPRHVLDLVEILHPTPAIAGAPVAAALDWIRNHERRPRGWYAGPIGWFDSRGDGDIRIALRSFVVADRKAHLFAGAGVVEGSDPGAELAEIDAKMEPARAALFGDRRRR